MADPILPRAFIAREADEAASLAARTGQQQANPYLPGTDAHAAWKASYERFLLAHSAPETEGSA